MTAEWCAPIQLPVSGAFLPWFKIRVETETEANFTISIKNLSGNLLGQCFYDSPWLSQEEEQWITCNYDEPIKLNVTEPNTYLVCIKDLLASATESNFSLWVEDQADTCGLIGGNNAFADPAVKVTYYKVLPFEDTKTIQIDSTHNPEILNEFNRILQEEYEFNCSEGCFFPFQLFGVQDLNVTGTIGYYTTFPTSSDKLYQFDIAYPSIYLNQSLVSLEPLQLLSPGVPGTYTLRVNIDGSTKLLGSIEVAQGPVISNFSCNYDLNHLPALTPVTCAVEAYSPNDILQYEFDFGISQVQTQQPFAQVTYLQPGIYNITVRVTDELGLSTQHTYKVEVKVPIEQLNQTLDALKQHLINLSNSLPSGLIGSTIEAEAKINEILNLINNLTQEFQEASQANDEAALLQIATELSNLKIPMQVEQKVQLQRTPAVIEIEPALVAELFNEAYDQSKAEMYKGFIASWMQEKGQIEIEGKSYEIKFNDDSSKFVTELIIYPFSTTEPAALFVKADIIKSNIPYQVLGSWNAFNLTQLELITLTDLAEVKIFVSPTLQTFASLLPPEHFCGDGICDEDESWRDCPEDCEKPAWLTWLPILIFIVIGAIIALIWISWIKTREKRLFPNKVDLINLVNFIGVCLNKGMKKEEIKEKEEKRSQFKEIISELEGTLNGIILDRELKKIDEFSIDELVDKIGNWDKEGSAIVFDGVITQKLVDLATEKGFEYIVGIKKSNIIRIPEEIKVMTIDEL